METETIKSLNEYKRSFVECQKYKNEPKLKKEKLYNFIIKNSETKTFNIIDESFLLWKPFFFLIPFDLLLKNDYPAEFENYKENCKKFLLTYNKDNRLLTYFNDDIPQLVPLYGLSIFIGYLNDEEVFKSIDRKRLHECLLKCKNEDGSFSSKPNSERDLRTTFAAIFTAWMFNILTDDIKQNVLEFTLSCYNFDGGFSSCKNSESHVGYIFAGVNILYILGELDKININKTIRYVSMRQNNLDGGFCGRPNKLSDSCYTWWLGSPLRVLCEHINIDPFWDQDLISIFIFQWTQFQNGGFSDQPSHQADPFHTLFATLGMFVCGLPSKYGIKNPENIHPVAGVPIDRFKNMRDYFYSLPKV